MKPRALALVAVLLVAAACAHADAEGGDARRTTYALGLLREWDQRRAQAWTDADALALAGLYTRGSRTGHNDRRMLATYAARGLRVADRKYLNLHPLKWIHNHGLAVGRRDELAERWYELELQLNDDDHFIAANRHLFQDLYYELVATA